MGNTISFCCFYSNSIFGLNTLTHFIYAYIAIFMVNSFLTKCTFLRVFIIIMAVVLQQNTTIIITEEQHHITFTESLKSSAYHFVSFYYYAFYVHVGVSISNCEFIFIYREHRFHKNAYFLSISF